MMIIKQAELETVCGITSKLPENAFPEVAFAGKSNVGKSSLINGLLNRKYRCPEPSSPQEPISGPRGLCVVLEAPDAG